MFQRIIALARKKLRKIPGFASKKPITSDELPVVGEAIAGQVEKTAVGIASTKDHDKGKAKEETVRPKKPAKPRWSLENFKVTPEEGKSRFHDFSLPKSLMHGIADLEFKYCTEIQAKALPEVLNGQDLIGQANTGTGKSAVFLVAIINKLLKEGREKSSGVRPRALIIAPTRELVTQIAKDGRKLAKYTPLRIVAVYGGVDYQLQIDNLKKGKCDVVVATPGRLLDYLGKRILSLDQTSTLVLDEADRMLDMGFIPDVRRIVQQLPAKEKRHTMLFSATITPEVKRLAYSWCKKPVTIEVAPEHIAVDTVEQLVYMVTEDEKYAVLYNLIQKEKDTKIIVFANQKNETKRLADRLSRNKINCVLLSGDVAQNKREKRLEDFRSGRVKVLVATDVAGRGIHIDGIEYVVNYTLPYEPEDYVHRIGRTGRAGTSGIAVSFACEKGAFYLPDIEEYIGRKLSCTMPEEELLVPPPKRAPIKNHPKKGPSKHYGKNKSNYKGQSNRKPQVKRETGQ